jgi:hypothetical protein
LAGNRGDGDQAALPEVLIIDFRDGDVELAAETVPQTFDVVPLVLKRVGLLQPQFEDEYSNARHSFRRKLR